MLEQRLLFFAAEFFRVGGHGAWALLDGVEDLVIGGVGLPLGLAQVLRKQQPAAQGMGVAVGTMAFTAVLLEELLAIDLCAGRQACQEQGGEYTALQRFT